MGEVGCCDCKSARNVFMLKLLKMEVLLGGTLRRAGRAVCELA